MPIVRLWVHAVWATKDRQPLLDVTIRSKVFGHILENGRKKGLGMDRVNGYVDHVHTLFLLPSDMPVAKALQLLKGESSFWINRNTIVPSRFEWQDEYFAKSVSEERLQATRQYIDFQEEHHSQATFEEEFRLLTKEFTSEL